jgi:hypothetical protein
MIETYLARLLAEPVSVMMPVLISDAFKFARRLLPLKDRMPLEMWINKMLPYTNIRDRFICVEQMGETSHAKSNRNRYFAFGLAACGTRSRW